MRQQRTQLRRKAKKNPGQGQNMAISHPPQIGNLNITHSVRMRFVANASAFVNITFQNLLDIFLVSTTTTALVDLFAAVKIRAVEVWAVPVIGNAATVEVTFLGNAIGQYSQTKTVTDTSMGVQPAHIRAVPAKQSTIALWQQSNADVALQLTCPAGAVIDMELSLVSRFATCTAAQNVGVGLTAGTLYVRGFDGLAAATSKFTPVADLVA
jgi:hypothetical protein